MNSKLLEAGDKINLIIGVSTWIFFANTFGSSSPFLQNYGNDFISFLILGLMFNSLFAYTLDGFRISTLLFLRGRIGSMGQHLSMYDYVKLCGIPVSVPILAWLIDGYIETSITLLVYLIAGIIFGLNIGSGNYLVALVGILIGLFAVAGIGLLSASMITIAGAWKGIEPISWLVKLLVGLLAGVYFPTEALPDSLQLISLLLPHTYALKIARMALLTGFGFESLISEFLAVSLMSLILFPLGIIVYRYSIALIKIKTLVE